MRKFLIWALLVVATGAMAQISSNGPVMADYGKHITGGDPAKAHLAKEVRHELLMLPWYSLFDDLGACLSKAQESDPCAFLSLGMD